MHGQGLREDMLGVQPSVHGIVLWLEMKRINNRSRVMHLGVQQRGLSGALEALLGGLLPDAAA